MRHLINIVESAQKPIVEEPLPPVINSWSKKPYIAYENPTIEEFLKALEDSKAHALRAILFDNGEIIVWDSEVALHSDVDKAYGASGGYNITIWYNHIDAQGNSKAAVRTAMKKNDVLIKIGVTRLRMT